MISSPVPLIGHADVQVTVDPFGFVISLLQEIP